MHCPTHGYNDTPLAPLPQKQVMPKITRANKRSRVSESSVIGVDRLKTLFCHYIFPRTKPTLRNKASIINGLICIAVRTRFIAEGAFVCYADVERELALEFIAQTQTGLDAAQTCVQAALRVVLAEKVDLCQRLQDQPISQQQFAFSLQPKHGLVRRRSPRPRTSVAPVSAH